MPQTLYWRGTATGNMVTLGNWHTTAGVSPTVALGTGDTYIFDWGSVDVDDGLTTGFTGITMIGTSGYSGRIAPGSALSMACSSLRWSNSGELNLTGNITAGRVSCRSGSMFNYVGGTATSLFIESSDYLIAAAAVITTGRFNLSNGSDLNNATAYTLCEVNGGTHTTKRKGIFTVVGGAKLVASTAAELDNGTIVHNNSAINYFSAEDIAGGDEVTVLPGGTFDASGNQSFTWDGVLNKWPGANIDLNTAGGEVVPATVNTYGLSSDVGAPILVP